MNRFTNYKDYAKEVEARLNRAVKFPVPCMVYERVRGEINRVRVSPTAPQINLSFRAFNSKINQTIYYFYNGKPQVKFENYSYSKEFNNWQHALEAAFKKLPEVPDPVEVPELDPIAELQIPEVEVINEEPTPVVEVIEEPVVEEPTEIVNDPEDDPDNYEDVPFIPGEPETVIEDPVIEKPAYVMTELDEAFITWALENLRTMNEDKASFKKDIPEEFAHMAATKRTITDGDILTILANRVPVEETTEE